MKVPLNLLREETEAGLSLIIQFKPTAGCVCAVLREPGTHQDRYHCIKYLEDTKDDWIVVWDAQEVTMREVWLWFADPFSYTPFYEEELNDDEDESV